ncbi:hypothetical protein EXIGLDRAFT_163239 [Exidia glandulosa HHB12029]|uniref:Uncharacterized protein n=1 Tax=Exidia glandulosa HHB12029 TaxID=1314781 RepID=A0A165FFF3_EXIGL|nr:hypothetical protein EXIGLDRAFT_163239 [Exidia glandulosa HHB12029]
MHDTDDSESESSSDDSDDADDAGSEDGESAVTRGLKRKLGQLDAPSDGGSSQGDESDVEDDDDASLSAQDALDNPIFELASPEGAQSCAICPGKVIKNVAIAKDHKTSGAHLRRLKRFVDACNALKSKALDLSTLSAASVVTAMDEKADFSQSSRPDSAKSRRKHKRDRGGKKRREAREQQRAAGGAFTSAPPAPSSADDKPKAARKISKTASDAVHSTTRKEPTATMKSSAQPAVKRIRRSNPLATKVRVVDV